MQRLTQPRFALLPLTAWDPELRARFEPAGSPGKVSDVIKTLAHYPGLLRPHQPSRPGRREAAAPANP